MVAGVPARPRREVTDHDLLRIRVTASSYAHLGRVYRGVEEMNPSYWAELDARDLK